MNMRYRFIKPWHEFKVGDRVPASVNQHWLKRQGYIAHYSFVQEAEELIAECTQELAQEAEEALEQAQEEEAVEEPQEATEEEQEAVEEPAPVVEAPPKPTGKGKRNNA